MIKKAINVEVKISLELPSKTSKIDATHPKSYRLTKKDKANRDN